ncbi:hypothetical protein KPH14_007421 [Odynerus spinipes]|uniref:Uncharacterized protein n=1 Tax=Odynerus spinipes TaxID=1348599 RepID=A0AAD9RAF8_9HYME|nr:hypothetical protein KPH14_007421 [Odynerus spinipes]
MTTDHAGYTRHFVAVAIGRVAALLAATRGTLRCLSSGSRPASDLASLRSTLKIAYENISGCEKDREKQIDG